jgi:hypothetical protein
VLNRIDVQNDPVNWIDPWGLRNYATHPLMKPRSGNTRDNKPIKFSDHFGMSPGPLQERRDYYEPQIRAKVDRLGRDTHLQTQVPSTGESLGRLFTWATAPLFSDGIDDALNDLFEDPCLF